MIPKRTGGVGHGYTGPDSSWDHERNHTWRCAVADCKYTRRASNIVGHPIPRCPTHRTPMVSRRDLPKQRRASAPSPSRSRRDR